MNWEKTLLGRGRVTGCDAVDASQTLSSRFLSEFVGARSTRWLRLRRHLCNCVRDAVGGAAFLTIPDNYDEGIDSRYELDRSSWGR
jgi:hypothetical protein